MVSYNNYYVHKYFLPSKISDICNIKKKLRENKLSITGAGAIPNMLNLSPLELNRS